MMRHALWVGVSVAALVFVRLVAVGSRGPLDNCVPLPDHPGAVVCGGRLARGVAFAAPLDSMATVETIVAGPLSTVAPTAEGIPQWMPGVCRGLWPTFSQAGATHGVSPTLLAIISLIESGCGGAVATSADADGVIRSSADAMGVMQIIPSTAQGIARNRGITLPADWRTNAAVQVDYAAWLLAGHMRAYGKPESVDPDYREAIRVSCIAYNGGGRAVMAYRSGNPYAESLAHSGLVVGMWIERASATSATFERWRNAGGYRWLD